MMANSQHITNVEPRALAENMSAKESRAESCQDAKMNSIILQVAAEHKIF